MRLRITDDARKDYFEAKGWYQEIDPVLGAIFEEAIESTLEEILEGPYRNQRISGDTRRAITQKFPFHIFYLISEERIIVTAILHQRRNPKLWDR